MGVRACQNVSNGSFQTCAFFLQVTFISIWKNKKHGTINSLEDIKTFAGVVNRRAPFSPETVIIGSFIMVLLVTYIPFRHSFVYCVR